tara:strand:+ start:267 stop:389 length:123 start_codon:yes stop_codon:yes gene_type:complete
VAVAEAGAGNEETGEEKTLLASDAEDEVEAEDELGLEGRW